ncbi:MAG: exodeoxyribonuclease III [Rickettsiales bacterium]
MKIATWNINSVRIRIDAIRQYLQHEHPDILCLQETKVQDDLFPVEAIKDLGFEYIYFHGEKSYNGVAILSKHELQLLDNLKFAEIPHTRHISALLPGDIELHNFYFPAGGDIPDIKLNPKFKHKLDYVREAKEWFSDNRKQDDKIILLGDLNIAPLENDVWSHKQLLNVVSHTPTEVEHLNNLYKSISFEDGVRKFVPEDQKLYSWWSYRNRDWKKSNRGRRLDHIWGTKPVADCISEHSILTLARDFEKPSDHVPVSITL